MVNHKLPATSYQLPAYVTPYGVEVGFVFEQGVGDVEGIGAAAFAEVAVDAEVYLVHFAAPGVGDVNAVRGALEEEAHAVAVLYLDADGAGLAVAAAAAEVAGELTAVFFDQLQHICCQRRRVVLIGQPFVELGFFLNAPDGGHLVLCQPSVGGGGVGDEATAETFHADEAHIRVESALHDVDVGLRGQVAEGVLEGFVEAAFDGFHGHALTVVGDADMQHFALTHSLFHCLVESAAVAGFGAEREVVELVEVDMVSAQQAQAGFEVFAETLGGCGTCFGANYHLVAAAFEGDAELLLAVGVEAGGVEVVHAAVEGAADEPDGVGLADALYGEGPKSVARHDEAAASKSYFLHISSFSAFTKS